MPKTEPEVSVSEWLIALMEAEQARVPDGALTVRQIAECTGKTKSWVLAKLARLKREGRLRVVRVLADAVDDSRRWSPAYIVVRRPSDADD